MRFLWMVLVMLIVPSVSLAAYQNPTVTANQRQANGSAIITFSFAGNAGEPTVERKYVIQQATTATALRNWIDDTINELDLVETASKLAILQPGQVVPKLARPAPSTPAKRIWQAKALTCAQYQGKFTGSLAAAVDAICADAQDTYQAGFLTE